MVGHTRTPWVSAVVTSASSTCSIQHHLHFHGPGLLGHSFAMSPSLKLTLWTSCHSVCLVVPQGFWTQSFGMKFNLHLVHCFFLYPVTEDDEVMFSGMLAQDLNP